MDASNPAVPDTRVPLFAVAIACSACSWLFNPLRVMAFASFAACPAGESADPAVGTTARETATIAAAARLRSLFIDLFPPCRGLRAWRAREGPLPASGALLRLAGNTGEWFFSRVQRAR